MAWTSLLAVAAMLAVGVPAAGAVFGDEFGIAPINGHPQATQEVPAFADHDHAFWAGTCDRGLAPAPPAVGDPAVPIPGGVGELPGTVFAPNAAGTAFVEVEAPGVPEHCVDQGAIASYGSVESWQAAPAWRLPAPVTAGAHPDGTTTMQFRRTVDGTRHNVDGALDNVQVDLPAGFIGNPQAVGECSAEQFAVKPLACPPESQVGVIRLQVEAIHADANVFAHVKERVYPVYNLQPRKGRVAELGFGYVVSEYTTVRLVAKARTNGDFGVTAFAGQIPATLPPIGQSITLWGVPWAEHNDVWRPKLGHFDNHACRAQPGGTGSGYIPWSGLAPECQASYDPSWGATPADRAIRPLISNETDCNPAPVARLAVDSYTHPGEFTGEGDADIPPYPWPGAGAASEEGNWKLYTSTSPAVTGCESLGFEPDGSFEPTTRIADGASGLDVELSLPQNNDPKDPAGAPLAAPAPGAPQADVDAYVQGATDFWRSDAGRATAHLKDTVVTLPHGMSVNPSGASGLRGCSDAQVGVRAQGDPPLFNNGDPFNKDGGADGAECPDGSKLGTVRVDTPLLAEPLTGELVLGQPKSTDPTSGEMLRLFVVARHRERGLVAKIYGSSVTDPTSGQITTTFANNPEVPFDKLSLAIEGGPRGLLAMPQRCGRPAWAADFTPWSAAYGAGGASVHDTARFDIDANCGYGFSPTMLGGTTPRTGGADTSFELSLFRRDGEQWLRGVSAQMPRGLLAAVKHVELCSNAQAAAGDCPLASQIGVVDAGAGSGTPFFLERPGRVYLTEGYRGAPYGLMVRVPVQAGPFRGALELDPIVVRQALHVDRRTAQVTAVSDPLPKIWHGIPLRGRQITVNVDRPGFMRNPTDCAPKRIATELTSTEGAVARPAVAFQAAGCKALDFEPRLGLRLGGRRQLRTNGHPAVRARLRQRAGEAGIRRAVVRLPRSLALDPANAQALCEFEDGTKPDLENHCPAGSIVGRARAVSPLLKDHLVGDVYFVKNVRIDPDTGNEIRTLPMLIVALRGEIAINLRGESSVDKRQRLVNTFAAVPDAPVSRFNLNVKGGRNGILVVTRTGRGEIDLCDGRQVAISRMLAHSGRRHADRARMRTPCGKRRVAPARVCRKRTDNRRALRRCIRKVKKNRAAKRTAATGQRADIRSRATQLRP